MTADDAAHELVSLIEAENLALEAGDAAAAAGLLHRKRVAADMLGQAPLDSDLLKRLHAAALRNETLLAQAMEVQARIVAMVVAAARRTAPPASFYRPDGRTAGAPPGVLSALSA